MPEPTIHHPFDLRITGVHAETATVKTLVLERADGAALQYQPGQFLTLRLPIHGRELRRSYSMSSVPGEALRITFKRYDNGTASRWLFDRAAPGDRLRATGPHGLFTRQGLPPATAQVFLYAAGVGITPVISLLRELLQRTTLPLVLFYSNRHPDEAVFRETLEALESEHNQRLRIGWFYSNSKLLLRARLTRSNLQQEIADSLQVPLPQTAHYVCGPPSYQFSIRSALAGMGIPAEQIRSESFDPAPPRSAPTLPDPVPRMVDISAGGQHRQLEVAPPLSILQAARKAGLNLPFSCDTGRCGACAARCLAGTVWMSNNEVLTPSDLAAGLVLTCTGHPVGEGLRIAF